MSADYAPCRIDRPSRECDYLVRRRLPRLGQREPRSRCSAERASCRRRAATSSISRSASPTSTRPSTSKRPARRRSTPTSRTTRPTPGIAELRDVVADVRDALSRLAHAVPRANVVVAPGAKTDHLELARGAARSGRRDDLRRSGVSDVRRVRPATSARSPSRCRCSSALAVAARSRRAGRQGHAAHQSAGPQQPAQSDRRRAHARGSCRRSPIAAIRRFLIVIRRDLLAATSTDRRSSRSRSSRGCATARSSSTASRRPTR